MDNDADVQGYVLAIQTGACSAGAIEITGFDASGATLAAGAELVVGEMFPGDNGATLGVVLDATAPFDGQTIATGAGSEVATIDIQQSGGPELSDFTCDICFVDGMLNDPPLSNIQVQAGLSIGTGAGLGLNCGTITVMAPAAVTFDMGDVSADATTDDGATANCADVPVLMDNLAPVQGYVLAIEISGDGTASSIQASGAAAAAGVEFEAPAILGGGTGATLGVVLDFLAPFDGQTIAPGGGQEIASVTVCPNDASCTPGSVQTLTLEFVDGVLDSPPLDNVAVIGGASESPDLFGGSATFNGVECGTVFEDLGFFCGGSDGAASQPSGLPGDTVDVCFYYTSEVNIQGFQLAVCFDCNLALGDFSIEGSIADEVGAEFVNYSTGNCELVAGILLDALPPFDGQTVPQTTGGDPLLIGCIDVTIADDDGLCDTCLDVSFCNGATGAGDVPIENIMVIDFGSFQDIPFTNCCVYVDPVPTFKRADCNDDDKCDLADSATILGQQFFGLEVPCKDACDVNDDGKINLADSVYLLNYLFKFGDAPPPPGEETGPDPTDDGLDCETAACG